ncbi:MAG: 50S ribosomal protein L18, partial [Burkholderiales bacterium]
MSDKNISRLRRARQTRIRIRDNNAVRLTVHRTNGHIYAQITSAAGDKVLASASSLEKEVRGQLKHGSTRKAAEVVGQRIA